MDLEELNRQMHFFQSDYSTNNTNINLLKPNQGITQSVQDSMPSSIPNDNINFPIPSNRLETTQIKRPQKTDGTHRNDINDKMNMINMNQINLPTPDQFNNSIKTVSNIHNQMTRESSKYVSDTSPASPISNYHSQNYSTLQGNNSQFNMPITNNLSSNIPTNLPNSLSNNSSFKTHDNGISFINPSNFYNNQIAPPNNPTQHDNGFHRIDEKRIDYRQNMNTKVGGFIFDNPNANNFNPVINQFQPNRDTRMVIQDSSKDYYRQEANSRMAQYSPLSRASHVPITIANMSVNDFYSNMPQSQQAQQNNYYNAEEDAKAVLNARLSSYVPLAKNVQYQPQQSTSQQMQQIYQKPKTWIENNVNRENPLVAHEELPVISN
jgi:hypothetical protein